MTIVSDTRPHGATKLARLAADVEGHIWDAAVPVRDTRISLSSESEARQLDYRRDAAVRQVLSGLRELMAVESVHAIRSGLQALIPAASFAAIVDIQIDDVTFGHAPVSLELAQEALLAGVHRCEKELSVG